ncbi:hypothetical protein UCRPC4_g00793 [Phaeomoniella chlamydospora]|uniref:Uncharacterized protein n=1 Tax=Phaeomoniella chlamydospora TaxID=158046 RepID=A0A0G2F0S4_PHACM|nr:hypothetical protein UCRPC4_g00793 [Phaeomoniella chlamydospora]
MATPEVNQKCVSQEQCDAAARAIMLDDLGGLRRGWLTEQDDDYARRFKHFAGVGTAQLESARAINTAGTGSSRRAINNKAALSAWSNLQNNLEDIEEVEALGDLMGGQSHRARLNAEITAAGGQAYSVDDQANLSTNDPDSSTKPSGRSQRGGRGGGVVGTRGRADFKPNTLHIQASRPLDPAVDPSRDYYLTRKKTRSKPAGTFSGRGAVRPVSASLKLSNRALKTISADNTLIGGKSQPAGGIRVGAMDSSVKKLKPRPASEAKRPFNDPSCLVSPEEFMALVAQRVRPGGPKPIAIMKTTPEPPAESTDLAENGEKSTVAPMHDLLTAKPKDLAINDVVSRPSKDIPSAAISSTSKKGFDIPAIINDTQTNAAPKMKAISLPGGIPVKRAYNAFDSLLAAPSAFMQSVHDTSTGPISPGLDLSKAQNVETNQDINMSSMKFSDADAFLAHVPNAPHAAPRSKAGSILSNAFNNPRLTKQSCSGPIVPPLTIPPPRPKSPGTDGLPSAVSERNVTFDQGSPPATNPKSSEVSSRSYRTASPEPSKHAVAFQSHPPGPISNPTDLHETQGDHMKSNGHDSPLRDLEIDLMDFPNDSLQTDTLMPKHLGQLEPSTPQSSMSVALGSAGGSPSVNAPAPKRVKIGGNWYILDQNQDDEDDAIKTSQSLTSVKPSPVLSISFSTKDDHSSHRVIPANVSTHSRRPPNHGRGTQKIEDDFLEDQKDIVMSHHSLAAEKYEALSRDQKVKLTKEAMQSLTKQTPQGHTRQLSALEKARIPPRVLGTISLPVPTLSSPAVQTPTEPNRHLRTRSVMSELSLSLSNVQISPEARATTDSDEKHRITGNSSPTRTLPHAASQSNDVSDTTTISAKSLFATTHPFVPKTPSEDSTNKATKTLTPRPEGDMSLPTSKSVATVVQPQLDYGKVLQSGKVESQSKPAIQSIHSSSKNPFARPLPDPIYGERFFMQEKDISKHAVRSGNAVPKQSQAFQASPEVVLRTQIPTQNHPMHSGNVAASKLSNVAGWLKDSVQESQNKHANTSEAPSKQLQHRIRQPPKPLRSLNGSEFAS